MSKDRCLTLSQFERYANGTAAPQEREACEQHLAECEDCRKAYEDGLCQNQFLLKIKAVLGRSADEPALTQTVQSARGGDAHSAAGPSADYLPQIEGYEVLRLIGRGGMGIVYEAIQTRLNRPVALKLLPAVVSSSNPHTVERFHREAAAAARLHHRNIIAIHDFGESRDGYYYAMELVEGLTLNALVRRLAADPSQACTEDSIVRLVGRREVNPADEPPDQPVEGGEARRHPGALRRSYYTQVAHWIAEVADGLHYAHLQGVIHRDIKPSNLMLGRDGRMLVLDFGLVKASGDESVTLSGSLIGTYRYMSPEQLGAKRIPVDVRTDIYSLGATLYELLALQPAFGASERSQLLSDIMFREPVRPRKLMPSVPAELENICLKAMEKSPQARYQSAGEMAEDLRRYLNDLPVLAHRQGPLRRGMKMLRRHRYGAMATAAIIIMAVTTVLLYHRGERRNREGALQSGLAHMYRESWDKAGTVFEEMIAKYPHDYPYNVKAYLNLAIVKNKQNYDQPNPKLLDEAIDCVEAAIRIDPQRRAAWNLEGVIYRVQGRLDEAEKAFRTAIEVKDDSDPPYPREPIYANLGAVCALRGDLLTAEQQLLTARKVGQEERRKQASVPLPHGLQAEDPGVNTLVNLAVVQAALGKTDDALAGVEHAWQVTRKRPEERLVYQPEIKLLKAKLILTRKDAIDVKGGLEAAMAADEVSEKDDPRAVIKRYLALALLRDGRWDQASNTAREAQKLAVAEFRTPDETSRESTAAQYTAAYSYLIMAIARARLGEATMARDYLREAVDNWPETLIQPDDVVVTINRETIWINSAGELISLREEAEQLVGLLAGRP